MSSTTTIILSDSEDGDMSSTVSSTDSFDLSLTDSFRDLMMDAQPTCMPTLYESSSPIYDSVKSGQYQFYAVYAGDQPGIYKDWADASGRVTNVKGNRHKGYKTWAQALKGWRQNCTAYHHHPPGFVDGTPYSPMVRPETPPSMTPPPSRHNTEHFNAAAKPSTKSAAQPSTSSLHTPQHPVRRTATDSHVQYWAIQSPGFVGVVSSTAQAQTIIEEAAGRNDDVSLRLVHNLSEAEEWFTAAQS
ncbi:hypothetical protein EV360DRAFT_89294 [Lentinula raphanica]|nr:hypothetical protein EV360DRAFT_89294 [Lentinula raphanica]